MEKIQEVWKDIPNYEGYYKVSNLGSVKSVEREIEVEQNALRIIDGKRGHKIVKLKKKIRGKIATQYKDKNGYLYVRLSKNGKQKTFYVHRLVYEAFIGEIPEGMEVNHISRVKTENFLENLNLMTPEENKAYSGWGKYKRA